MSDKRDDLGKEARTETDAPLSLAVSMARGTTARLPRHTTTQDYLEQIHGLIESKGYARVVDIAGNLGISLSSVTAMIQRLDADGLVIYEKYRGIVLTERGRQVAREIIERHEVLSRLLRHFGIDEATIYEDVEGMEHHMSAATLRAFTLLTEELDRNPQWVNRMREASSHA